jgi:hypothetical protein
VMKRVLVFGNHHHTFLRISNAPFKSPDLA